MRTSKPITVTLGPQQASLNARLESGAYGSASEVLREALRALDREDAALDEVLRRKVQAALADPRPSIPADEVFAGLEQAAQEPSPPRGYGIHTSGIARPVSF